MAECISNVEAVVVGAGQCGLGVSYNLARAGLPHRVLERGRIGETWRSQRWDGFRMNTPNAINLLPGSLNEGAEPEDFMGAGDFLAQLEDFATRHQLPVETETPVLALDRDPEAGLYRLATPRETILARSVVIAGGSENRPRLPPLAGSLPGGLRQLHAAEYRNAAALPAGAVLVVGSASSGVQIAADLLDAGREVYIATGRVARVPRRYRGRDMLLWRAESGYLDQTAEAVPPAARVGLQLAAKRVLSLQSLSVRGAVLLGRLTGAEGSQLTFGEDLAENIRFAEDGAGRARAWVDDHIAQNGIDAPPAERDPAEVAPRLPDPPIRALVLARAGIATVLWCTGFGPDHGWVRLPVFDARGAPMHDRGAATACPGIFFIGLPWLATRKSALIAGVADEATRIAGQVVARR